MKFLKLALAASILTGFAASANAQDSSVYVNLGAESFEFDSTNVVGRVGYRVWENFAVEGQASLGVAPDDVNGFDVGVDNSFGVFVRGNLPVGEKFSLFSRTGYHFTKIGVDGEGFDESASINGFAYGGGLEYLFDGQNGIRADITLLNSNGSSNGIDISGTASTFSLAYVRNF